MTTNAPRSSDRAAGRASGAADFELQALLTRVGQQDRAAFASLYQRTSAKLMGVVLRILGNREIAEEVVQETFVKVWRSAERFDPKVAAPMTWLASIARNQAIDTKRRSAERLSAATVEFDDGGLASSGTLDPAAMADDLSQLRECLEKLPEDRRQMVLLAYYTGCSREELSTRFARPVGTIKILLHRSLAILKVCLDGGR